MIPNLFPSDATQLYQWLWACYDAGRAHERGEQPLGIGGDAEAMIAIVAMDWHYRMERYGQCERRPAWLTRLYEESPGLARWAETGDTR